MVTEPIPFSTCCQAATKPTACCLYRNTQPFSHGVGFRRHVGEDGCSQYPLRESLFRGVNAAELALRYRKSSRRSRTITVCLIPSRFVSSFYRSAIPDIDATLSARRANKHHRSERPSLPADFHTFAAMISDIRANRFALEHTQRVRAVRLLRSEEHTSE